MGRKTPLGEAVAAKPAGSRRVLYALRGGIGISFTARAADKVITHLVKESYHIATDLGCVGTEAWAVFCLIVPGLMVLGSDHRTSAALP